MGQPVEFAVHEGHEALERALIPCPPGDEQPGDLVWRRRGH
jgi:hypothetical protein